nr:MAG TPA: hypothetical protein [Bacteriophage sp.]
MGRKTFKLNCLLIVQFLHFLKPLPFMFSHSVLVVRL